MSHYLILARTETQSLKDGIPLLVEKGVLLLVDASLPGIVVKRGEIVLDNVVVPTSQVIGSVGEGHTFAVATLHDVRFGFDALLLGMCKATVKKASRNPLVDVSILARCSALLYGLESTLYLFAANRDKDVPDCLVESCGLSLLAQWTVRAVYHHLISARGPSLPNCISAATTSSSGEGDDLDLCTLLRDTTIQLLRRE